jgi:hypothetical protein
MRRYLALQPYFARRRFVGIDPLTHLHVLDADGGAVLTAYNLTATSVRRSVSITSAAMPLGGTPEVTGAPGATADGVLTIDLVIPPLSPLVVEIGTVIRK